MHYTNGQTNGNYIFNLISAKSLANRPPEYKPKLHLYIQEDNDTLRGATLEETVSEKYSGVIIDNKLSFREQIDTKTSKANTAIGIIWWTFDYMAKQTLMLLYIS